MSDRFFIRQFATANREVVETPEIYVLKTESLKRFGMVAVDHRGERTHVVHFDKPAASLYECASYEDAVARWLATKADRDRYRELLRETKALRDSVNTILKGTDDAKTL